MLGLSLRFIRCQAGLYWSPGLSLGLGQVHVYIQQPYLVDIQEFSQTGNAAIVRSYVSEATTDKERVGAMAGVSGSQAIGFIIGPGV